MNNVQEFEIVRGKGRFGPSDKVEKIAEILVKNRESVNCKEMRILHCKNLSSVQGIEQCKMLVSLNLSSNMLKNIDGLRGLARLEILDVKANRITSLKPIQGLSYLKKIDASQNKIQSLQGFTQANSQLHSIILFHNQLTQLDELSIFKQFNKLQQICFERNNKSNPFCQNRNIYYHHLREALVSSRFMLQKVDDIIGKDIEAFFKGKENVIQEEKSEEFSKSNEEYSRQHSAQFENRRVMTATHGLPPHSPANNNLASQKIMHLTQRQYDLERLVDIKDDAIDELRSKNANLQLTNANFYKDALKKEVEYERVYGQVSELAKNIDQKDAKINELHKRIEQLLKINANSSNSGQARTQELQKLRKQYNDLRIQNAQLKVLSKDQESRLKDMQERALANIEDKSHRIEELRCRNEELMREHYQSQKLQDEYKDRVRELTQLLKEWEFKYEQKIKEMEVYHNSERTQIIKQFQCKEEETAKNYESTVKKLYQEFEAKIRDLEHQYTEALEASLHKYGILKRSYDDRTTSQQELKNILKVVVAKKAEQEQHINQCQEIIVSNRKKIHELSQQNEMIIRQLSELRARYQIDVKQLQDQIAKLSYERKNLEVENRDLRNSNEYLQTHFDNLNTKEKEVQELEEKVQNLQTALDAKNIMLDDKNDTIQSLKLEIESAQKDQEGRVDIAEYEKVNMKYRKSKDKVKQLEEKLELMIVQNKEVNEKLQVFGDLEKEFYEVKDIMNRQQGEIAEKNTSIEELVNVVQTIKGRLATYQDEMNQLKGQKNRLLNSLDEKENRWSRVLREKEGEFEQKEKRYKQEMLKLKEVVKHLNQISSLTQGINF